MNTKLNGKKSFLMYHDICDVFGELSDEQAGKMIKELITFSKNLTQGNPNKPSGLSGLLKVLEIPFKQQMVRDYGKWESIANRNKNNGKLGGRPKKKNPKEPKKPVKVKVKVKGTVKVKETTLQKHHNGGELFAEFSFAKGNEFPVVWKDFVAMRKSIKKPLTDRAKKLILKKVFDLQKQGNDPIAVLDQSIEHNWQTVYALKDDNPAKKTTKKLFTPNFNPQ